LSIGFSHLRRASQLAIFGPNTEQAGTEVTLRRGSEVEKEDEVEDDKNGVFLPNEPWKEIWDMAILTFILYSAIFVPFRICFDASAEGYMFVFEQLLTLSFVADVCFNFNTAYQEDAVWIVDRERIAHRYFQGWFWIDAPSSVPIELIDLFLDGDAASLGLLKFLRLFRLLRLLRLLKVHRQRLIVRPLELACSPPRPALTEVSGLRCDAARHCADRRICVSARDEVRSQSDVLAHRSDDTQHDFPRAHVGMLLVLLRHAGRLGRRHCHMGEHIRGRFGTSC
jgi:hypothetical protein